MTMDAPPGGLPQTPEEILQLLKAYEAGGGDISATPELKDLLNEVQRSQGHAPAAQEGPTEEVTPEPGFVVKTADDTGRKVFVNVCSSHSIAAPGGWENGQIPEEAKQALANLDSVADGADGHEHLRFPLSMGPPGSDVDRRGELCTVFDCIFNSDVLAAARSLRSLKMFLIELALGWISQKHKLTLDPKYKLPKLAYKGDSVRGQRIRAARKPLVSEVCDVEEEPEFALLSKPRPPAPTPKPVPPASGCGTAPPSCANTGAAVGRAAQLQQQQQQGISRGVAGSSVAAAPPSSSASLEAPNPAGPSLPFTLQFSGRPAETALLTLDLPPGCSPVAAASPPELHIRLDVGSLGSHVAVEVQGIGHCSVELPLSVTTLGARAELLGGASQLQLSLPFRSVGSLLAEMQARRPHAHGSIGMANREYLELEV